MEKKMSGFNYIHLFGHICYIGLISGEQPLCVCLSITTVCSDQRHMEEILLRQNEYKI